jgi:hypothetical protein
MGKNIQQMMLEQLYSHVQKKQITNLPHTRHKIQLIMAENSKYKMGQNWRVFLTWKISYILIWHQRKYSKSK